MSKKDLSVLAPEKKDAFNRIVRWYSKSDITLTPDEEHILARWCHVDARWREGMDEQAIVDDLKEKFGISSFTAQRDIGHAQQLFARVKQVSKKYLLDLHRQNIERDLMKVRKQLWEPCVDETGKSIPRNPDDKEISALARLNDSYTKAVVALPDDQQDDPLPPPKFIFQLAPGQKIEVDMGYEDAAALADSIEDLKEVDGVYQSDDDEAGN